MLILAIVRSMIVFCTELFFCQYRIKTKAQHVIMTIFFNQLNKLQQIKVRIKNESVMVSPLSYIKNKTINYAVDSQL